MKVGDIVTLSLRSKDGRVKVSTYARGTNPPYPGWDKGRQVKVTAEYPTFFVVLALPRMTPLGLTEPYTVTIDKWDLEHNLWMVS